MLPNFKRVLGHSVMLFGIGALIGLVISHQRNSGLGFRANGSAQIGDGWLRLTDGHSQNSTVWFDPLVNGDRFTATFDFAITDKGGIGWGDGFTFAVVNGNVDGQHAVGVSGGQLGYGGLSGFAVEFDTYVNAGYGDASDLHVGLNVGGSAVSATTSGPLPFDLRCNSDVSIRDRGWRGCGGWVFRCLAAVNSG